MSNRKGPLARFRVLDLTRARAGPTAARMLADWGAETIKIEQPQSLAEVSLGGARDGSDFQNLHRNKRSITINLKDPKGVEIFLKLAQKSDVIIENDLWRMWYLSCTKWEIREGKPSPNYNIKYAESKDGIHMTFPKIKAHKTLYKLLVDKILEDKDLLNDILLKTCENNPDNKIEDIVDSSIYQTNWLVYGSRKTGEDSRYELTRIITVNSQKQISDFDIDIYLQNPITIIKNNSVYQTNVNTDYTEISQQYLNTINLNINSNISFMDLDMEEENNFISNIKEKEIELIRILVDKLDSERAITYESWRNVGLLLHGISKRKEMLDIWKSFSRKASNYDEKGCDDKWKDWKKNTRKENVLTVKTLHWWVRQDISIEDYRNIIKESLITKINQSLEGEKNTGAHYDVANVIADYYKNEFVC